jgi:hypothetical protein
MKSINDILDMSNLFVSLAEDENYALTEAQKEYSRKYMRMIRELAKTDPEDPRVQKYLDRRKWEQMVHKELMLSDPEYAKHNRELSKNRTRNYQQRISIEEAEEQERKEKERMALEIKQRQELKQSKTLPGYILQLSTQIASTRNELRKYILSRPNEERTNLAIGKFNQFDSKIKSLYEFRDGAKKIATNTLNGTITPNIISNTIGLGQNLIPEIEALNFKAIVNTIKLIIKELRNVADMYTKR